MPIWGPTKRTSLLPMVSAKPSPSATAKSPGRPRKKFRKHCKNNNTRVIQQHQPSILKLSMHEMAIILLTNVCFLWGNPPHLRFLRSLQICAIWDQSPQKTASLSAVGEGLYDRLLLLFPWHQKPLKKQQTSTRDNRLAPLRRVFGRCHLGPILLKKQRCGPVFKILSSYKEGCCSSVASLGSKFNGHGRILQIHEPM